MTTDLQTLMPEIFDTLNGVKGRKYISDATARTLAIIWSGMDRPMIDSLMESGAIPNVSDLRRELFRAADAIAHVSGWDDVREDLYASLIALDVYVCQWKKSRKPVKDWSPALALVA